jgi:tetratricopeptide (TPR) repeat protein
MNNILDREYNSAMEFLADGKLAKAKRVLSKMQSIDPQDPRTLEIGGDCAKNDGDYEQAEKLYRLMSQSRDANVSARGNLSLGYLFRETDAYPEAIAAFTSAAKHFAQTEEVFDHICSLGSIGEIHFDQGYIESAAEAFETVVTTYADAEMDEMCVQYFLDSARQFADCLRLLGNLDEATTQYQAVIEIAGQYDFNSEVANALDGLGVVHQIRGEYEEALQLHKDALQLNDELGEKQGKSVNLGNLARLQIHLENWEEARKYALQTLAIETEEESIDGIGFAKLLLAEIDIGLKNYAEAEKQLLQLQKLFQREGAMDDYVAVISTLGYLKRLQGELPEAERLQEETLGIVQQLKNSDFMASVYDELAEIRLAQQRIDDAREYWKKALKISEELDSSKMIKNITLRLQQLDNQ